MTEHTPFEKAGMLGAPDHYEVEVVCECEYPHLNDFDPYHFEKCTCESDCYHLVKVDITGKTA